MAEDEPPQLAPGQGCFRPYHGIATVSSVGRGQVMPQVACVALTDRPTHLQQNRSILTTTLDSN